MIKYKLINKFFYLYFLFSLIFSVTLSPIIEAAFGFKYTDELIYLLVLLLFIFVLKFTKKITIFISILLFYAIYSYVIHSNVLPAILTDFVIQSKPFMIFFVTLQAAPILSNKNKKTLSTTCICLFVFYLFIAFFALASGDVKMFMGKYFTDTGTAFSSGIIIISIFYLMVSKNTNKNKFIIICMLAVACITMKARVYGFFMATMFLFLVGKQIKFKLTLKNVLLLGIALSSILYVAWDKIEIYFTPKNVDETARLALYSNSIKIIKDYFPFGSGLASYGTQASRAYYSKVYYQYDMSAIWGLSKSHDSFITDTYFPTLAQFGFLGIILFILFWYYVFKQFRSHNTKISKSVQQNLHILFYLIIAFLVIESIASAVLTSYRGMMIMSMIALLLVEKRRNTNSGALFIKENTKNDR